MADNVVESKLRADAREVVAAFGQFERAIEAAEKRLASAKAQAGEFAAKLDAARGAAGATAPLQKALNDTAKSADAAGRAGRDAGRELADGAKVAAPEWLKASAALRGIALGGTGLVLGAYGLRALTTETLALGEALLKAKARSDAFAAGMVFATGRGLSGAREEMQFVSALSDRLGLSLASTGENWMKFAAAAKGTQIEGQKARDVFEAVSEAVTVMHLPAERAEGAFRALYQMLSKGTVQSEELRGQLGDQLPGAFEISAKALGVTTSRLQQMLEAGEVVSADFLPKFAAALRENLGNATEQASQGAQQAMNRLGNAWERLMRTLGDGAAGKIARGTVDDLRRGVEAFDEALQNVSGPEARALQLGKQIVELGARAQALANSPDRAQRGRSGSVLDEQAARVRELLELQKQLDKNFIDPSFTAAEMARLGLSTARAVEPTRALLDLIRESDGGNEKFASKMKIIADNIASGAVEAGKYDAVIRRLIFTETDAGKAAAAAMERRLAGYNQLREALTRAIEQSREEGRVAREAAKNAREARAQVGVETADRINRVRRSQLAPDQQAEFDSEVAQIKLSGAGQALSDARFAKTADDLERILRRAESFAQQAAQLGESLGSEELIQRAGQALEDAQKAREDAANRKATDADARVVAQAKALAEAEQRTRELAKEMQGLGLKVDTSGFLADMDQALAKARELRAEIQSIGLPAGLPSGVSGRGNAFTNVSAADAIQVPTVPTAGAPGETVKLDLSVGGGTFSAEMPRSTWLSLRDSARLEALKAGVN